MYNMDLSSSNDTEVWASFPIVCIYSPWEVQSGSIQLH